MSEKRRRAKSALKQMADTQGQELIRQIQAALASARRRESRMLRRLGRKAMEALSEGQGLSPEDGHIQLMVEDLRRVQGEIGCLLDKLRQARASPFSARTLYPPPPGSDTHFPFSR
ncbi:MAG: hypothetical protein ACUVS3_14240 [Thermodesulfobacteriota bacterium]